MKAYGEKRAGLAGQVLSTLPGKLASHWVFQGMLYMDRSERLFKVGLDVAGAGLLFALLTRRPGTSRPAAAIAALGLAHTANMLLNGHLFGALKWHRIGARSTDDLERYLDDISARLRRSPHIAGAWLYGSAVRGELHDGSDLDIRVLRRPGATAALLAPALIATERARALMLAIPLDIYLWDPPLREGRMRADEVALDLLVARDPQA